MGRFHTFWGQAKIAHLSRTPVDNIYYTSVKQFLLSEILISEKNNLEYYLRKYHKKL